MTTAFDKYQRLEASALWREGPSAQRREVILSIGDASLIISDLQDRPLGHWSLAAVERQNPGSTPAIFFPGGDPEETLELQENETEMVEAIETLRKALNGPKSRPGRLRWAILGVSLSALVAGLVFWLPGALRNHVTGLVPNLNRVIIGHDVLTHLERTTGATCHNDAADAALVKLAEFLGVAEIVVVPSGVKTTASLPGTALVLGRSVVEDHDDPAAAMGFMLAEKLYAETSDPLERILLHGGFRASFDLLTTGQIAPETLSRYAEYLATTEPPTMDEQKLIAAFSYIGLPAAPYAYALDISGETTIGLIEADAVLSPRDNVLSDREWVALQEICAG